MEKKIDWSNIKGLKILNDDAQLMPSLSDEEYEALKADIAERGVMVPIEFDEDGQVLDGYHRLRACQELDIADYSRIVRKGMTDKEKIEHILTLNLARRHLTREQLKDLGKRLWLRGWSQEEIGHAFGVARTTINNWAKEWPKGDNVKIDIVPPSRADSLGRQQPRRYKPHKKPRSTFIPDSNTSVRKQHPATQRDRKQPELKGQFGGLEIRVGDFRKVLADIPNQTVDLILTDPPYGKRYLDLWNDLGAFAARVLKPSGALITYSGQLYLPEVIQSLGRHLQWWWLCSIVHGGLGNLTLLGHPVRKVINQFKPLLIFIPYGSTGIEVVFRDLVQGEGSDKQLHNWQQPVDEAKAILEVFGEPDNLVIDPFAGSGAFGEAAIQLGMKFIGAEVLKREE